jgi:hypothetical protein
MVSSIRWPKGKISILCDLDLTFGTEILEVLVAEYDDLPLGDIESKFIQTLLGELRELYTMDFSTEIRTNVEHLGVGGEEVGFLGVSAAAWVDVV